MGPSIKNKEFNAAIAYWKKHQYCNPSSLINSVEMRFSCKFAIILCTEACIQMGKEIMQLVNGSESLSQVGIFYDLHTAGFLDDKETKRMAHLVHYRNRLVHECMETDIDELVSVLAQEINMILIFQRKVLKWERNYRKKTIITQLTEGVKIKTVFQSFF